MENDKIIRKYTYSDGKRAYRPNKPKGEDAMRDISDELWQHFNLMAGNDNRRYKGTKKDRAKIRGLYKTTEMMFDSGITCDLIDLELDGSGSKSQERIFTSSGAVETPEHIFSCIPSTESHFLTSRATRSLLDPSAKAPRDLMYRSIGTLIKGPAVYNIYHIYAVNEMWWNDVEIQMSEALKKKIEDNLPYFKDNNKKIIRKSAIFYFTSEAVLRDFMLTLKSKRENRIEPDAVYNLSYAVYLSGNAGDITNMLLVPDWKKKLNSLLSRILNAEETPEEKCDMKMNGLPVYNLLCCNIGMIRKLKGLITKNECIILIHPWMRDLTDTLYEGKPETVEISDKIFRKMLNTLI